MAIFYLRSTDGDDADNGSTWALAKATLAGAFAAAAAGDTIYTSQSHAETQATNMTLTSPGTAASPCRIICVNDGAEPPTAVATTATITTTGTTSITHAGFAYYYGITFSAGTSTGANARQNWAGSTQLFHACTLATAATGSGGVFVVGNATAGGQLVLINSNVSFASASGGIRPISRFIWRGGTLSAAPTSLVLPASGVNAMGQATIEGCDLSAITTGKYIADVSISTSTDIRVRNCKLGASGGMVTGTIPYQLSTVFEAINVDSADTNYRYWYQDYSGSIEHETTILRTGGSAVSREMITTANASVRRPLVLTDMIANNTITGSSITITAYVATDNVTLTDQDMWLEIEYPGTSGFPLAVFADDADSLSDRLLGGSATAQTTSSESWVSVPGTPVKQELSVSVTPTKAGPIRCRVVLAKPSTTVYVDMDPTITSFSSTNQFMAANNAWILETAGAGGSVAGSMQHTGFGRAATY